MSPRDRMAALWYPDGAVARTVCGTESVGPVNFTLPPLSIGSFIALVVLVLVVVAFVFSAAMPSWLPLLLIGALALARLC